VTSKEPTTARAPSSHDFDAQVTGIAALAEPVRRSLYRYVVAQPGPVSRDQASTGVDVARHVAKFHLDKLVEDGLLEVSYARPPWRRGPGAGRPAKLYRRSARDLAVSLPTRDYELAGRLLARAVTDAQSDGVPISDALGHAARDTGQGLGHRARQRAGRRPNRAEVLAATTGVLRDCGYEPRVQDGDVSLANCPFDALSRDYTDLVCGMNLELMSGLVEGLDRADFQARLEPTPGQCCVRLRTPKPSQSRNRRSTKEAT
jgi:predicted ArsR family transcriptional regulator